jgi:Na+/melibiose symporter-like transporter
MAKSERSAPAVAPESPPSESSSSLTTTSQGFYPPPPPGVLRRSMILSCIASAFGAVFFSVIQGTVFNFFLEDLSMRERLPYFMALWSIAGIGTLIGSWIQERWSCRKGLFLWAIGGSRLTWLAIGLVPLLWPEMRDSKPAFVWLTILVLLFYFIHSLGTNAWLSWMADLVPARSQGAYWAFRQVGCAGGAALSRVAFGYYLELHRDFSGYAVVLSIATLFGVIDALLFIFVEHRQPKRRPKQVNIIVEFVHRFREAPFRRLCGVYLFWALSNCVMGPTLYYYLRDTIGLGVQQISLIETFTLLAFIVSLAWGRYSDAHGHRGPLVISLLLHGLYLGAFFFAGRGDFWFVSVVMVVGAVAFCGINLYMLPMLINISKARSAGREITMAAFSVLMAFTSFSGLIVVDQYMFHWLGGIVKADHHSTPVYLAAMVVGMTFRFLAAGLAAMLPKAERDTPPGVLIFEMVMTTPLRAMVSFFRFVTRQDADESPITSAVQPPETAPAKAADTENREQV